MRTLSNRFVPVNGFARRNFATATGKVMTDAELLESSVIADKYTFNPSESLAKRIVATFGKIVKIVLTYNEETDLNGIEIQTENGKRIFAKAWKGEANKNVSLPSQELDASKCVIGRCKSGDVEINNIYVDITAAL